METGIFSARGISAYGILGQARTLPQWWEGEGLGQKQKVEHRASFQKIGRSGGVGQGPSPLVRGRGKKKGKERMGGVGRLGGAGIMKGI